MSLGPSGTSKYDHKIHVRGLPDHVVGPMATRTRVR